MDNNETEQAFVKAFTDMDKWLKEPSELQKMKWMFLEGYKYGINKIYAE